HGIRVEEVHTIGELLPLTQREAVLELRHVQLRTVCDRGAVTEEIGVAGIARIDVSLHEEPVPARTRLQVTRPPIHRLTGAQAGQLDTIGLTHPAGNDQRGGIGRPPVGPRLEAPALYVV